MKFSVIDGGVTAAKGFEAAGAAAGIKYQNRMDMAIVYSKTPCKLGATFTTNVVKAAPVLWDKAILDKGGPVQAIVVNAGIANACTGKEGMDLCRQTAEYTAKTLGLDTDVLVASTGVIGMQLPIDRICHGIDLLARGIDGSRESGGAAAKAIMTTDTVSKEVAVECVIGGKKVTIGGMCKGSGMIHPNMCTMLAFVTTDVNISGELLQKAVSRSVTDSYNMISVDGDTSTNDTLLVLANGLAGNPCLETEGEDFDTFCQALDDVNTCLAKKMAGDGEGATALFETRVIHADTRESARCLAKSVICSSLTKAAIFGHDANWGRILCAMGYSGAEFDPDRVELFFESKAGKIQIFGGGKACDYSEAEAAKILSEPEVCVIADMHAGQEEAVAWGCDLSYDYVKINADYRS